MGDKLFVALIRQLWDISKNKTIDDKSLNLSVKPASKHLKSSVQTVPFAKTIRVTDHLRKMALLVKVLIVSSEVVPFAKTGGLADVSASLAKALSGFGCRVRIIMPLYKCVLEGGFNFKKETPRLKNMPGFALYSTVSDGIKVYFLRNDKYFAREGLYGTSRGDYSDNALRFGFFSEAVLRAVESVRYKPDIIHCNDWQTALIPFHLKFNFNSMNFYKRIKTLFTIHNMAYQGIFDKKFMRELNIPKSFFNMHQMEFYGKLNFMKAGILYSDRLNTVSERYAGEIMTPEYGAGFDGLIRAKKEKFSGIPNGVDYSVWSPEKDPFIKTNFSPETIEKKTECKKDLLDCTRLVVSPRTPIIGCVTRLTDGKGMDLFAGIIEKIVELGCGIVVLGRGSRHYNDLFASLAKKFPEKMYMSGEFNDPLAHKIEAGADIFVMPSRYEPCGLNQMYSIKYGTIPVVSSTGGLDDAIWDFDEGKEKANGFKFAPATKEAFFTAVKRAVDLYKTDQPAWKRLMLTAMRYDFSWDKSAKKYVELYREILSDMCLEGE